VLFVIAFAGGIALDRAVLRPAAPGIALRDASKDSAKTKGALEIDAARIRDADIGLLSVAPGRVTDQILAQATVAATPDGAAVIGARADGTVTQIRKRLGDSVAKGESLGAVQGREAARLAGDEAAARARLAKAQLACERQKRLLAAGATARQDYDAAQAEWGVAKAELSRARRASAASGAISDGVSLAIISPVSGRITSASAVLGAYVVAGTELFRVADPARLEIQAAIPAAETRRVAVGDRATVEFPDGTLEARVRAITPDVGLQSRAATVVLTPLGGAPSLQPGQLVSVRIAVAHGHDDSRTILVPSDAVQKIDGGDAVFVRTDAGFRVRAVTAGAENGGMTEIRAGLRGGERIAAVNAFLLKAELEKGSGDHD
jgi:cobalt-zinc-cadmium efflux system membrane fusion protein